MYRRLHHSLSCNWCNGCTLTLRKLILIFSLIKLTAYIYIRFSLSLSLSFSLAFFFYLLKYFKLNNACYCYSFLFLLLSILSFKLPINIIIITFIIIPYSAIMSSSQQSKSRILSQSACSQCKRFLPRSHIRSFCGR